MSLIHADANAQGQASGAEAGAAEYLTFMLGGEMFAIAILCIKEIIEYCEPDTVPLMPPAIRGVINLRGAAVPVLDLSVRFGRGPSTLTRRSCIVILELDGEQQVIGVLVDAVNAVLEIDAADIEPAPAFGAVNADFLAGMGKLKGRFEGRFVLLLNAKRVFSRADIGAAMRAAGQDVAPQDVPQQEARQDAQQDRTQQEAAA
ncbi:MAG: chemotaxis protein CheW [Pseudomonadota bacterium]